MLSALRSASLRSSLAEQLPLAATSLALTEGLYRLGSFTLELAAFLGTWWVLDTAWSVARRAFEHRS